MFAGHVGAALVIGRIERRINVGVFVVAALLLDLVLWLCVLFGLESVAIPENFAATHQPRYVFPYSHGLLAAVAWSVVATLGAVFAFHRLDAGRRRAAALVAAAVYSHWLLDVLVHAPELPLAGPGSLQLGLGLWQAMPIALGVESLIVVAGVGLFVQGSALRPVRKLWISALALCVLAFTLFGMTLAPPAPSAAAMATSSLFAIAAVCALLAWLGRRAR